MRTSESVVVPAPPPRVFEHVARLEAYPAWLGLVHDVEVIGDEADLVWSVELRARVGPFARSKRLRMVRTDYRPDRLAVFDRAEVDGRDHARWSLRAEVEPSGDAATELTMHLAYDGALWTGGLLERVLDDEIRRGRSALVGLVRGEPTR